MPGSLEGKWALAQWGIPSSESLWGLGALFGNLL